MGALPLRYTVSRSTPYKLFALDDALELLFFGLRRLFNRHVFLLILETRIKCELSLPKRQTKTQMQTRNPTRNELNVP